MEIQPRISQIKCINMSGLENHMPQLVIEYRRQVSSKRRRMVDLVWEICHRDITTMISSSMLLARKIYLSLITISSWIPNRRKRLGLTWQSWRKTWETRLKRSKIYVNKPGRTQSQQCFQPRVKRQKSIRFPPPAIICNTNKLELFPHSRTTGLRLAIIIEG